jgi:hypothetical protein
MSTPDPRPLITPALERLIEDLIARLPALAGLVASDVIVVGLAAHGTAVASVRGLLDVARAVHVGGARRRIELGLRPGFFLEGDAPRRLTTILHELLHVDPARPGHLLEERRHRRLSHAAHEKEARSCARRYLEMADPVHLLCLAHEGEVLLRHWRHRPCETTKTRRFSDKDVFDAPVRIATPPGARGGWW